MGGAGSFHISEDQGSVWEVCDLGQHFRQEEPNFSNVSNLVKFLRG